MENFTPISAIIGGLLIGISSITILYFNGRLAAISGIIAGIKFKKTEFQWRILFLLGLIIGANLYSYFTTDKEYIINDNILIMAIGGFLTGIGTYISSGCTSGHGVSGIARLSVRSITATIIFLSVAMLVVYLKNIFD